MSVLTLPAAKLAEKDSTPDHTELAGYIGERGKLISNRGDFWDYSADAGIWQKVPTEMLHRRIQEVCRQFGIAASSSRITGTEKMAHGVWYRDIEWDATGKRDIAVQNGILHYEGGGKWVVKPYRAEDYRRVSLPIKYDPDADCPRFTQFVQEVFHGTDDAKERIVALVELMGLTLTASTEFEKAALLVGSGSNGKSVTLRLLADMVGQYASGINPAEFENRFQRASLDGKLANIVTELPEGTTLPDGAIKAIISGEACTVEHKHRDPFVMTPICKIWLGSNHMPGTRDFSPALFRRFTILKFPNEYPEESRDVRLSEKLRAEIPGILNILLAALGNAFDRGHLTSPPSSVEAVNQWKRDSDQVLTFLEEQMVQEPGARIASAEAFSLYQQWASSAGIKRPVSRNPFTRRIKALMWAEDGKGTAGERFLYGLRQRLAGDL
ncbi:phage/plasmid primase, P4 family [Acidithiobacillus sp.]|uniref:DNA primase family protein n=1 Tax=Acidithiobacillus sp. TaxID=1872118 RepID=UPI0025C5DBBD|nr:phage/plasmid primase, P4 family [Acidithiobacillus sp.]